jgi:hypothetical protein
VLSSLGQGGTSWQHRFAAHNAAGSAEKKGRLSRIAVRADRRGAHFMLSATQLPPPYRVDCVFQVQQCHSFLTPFSVSHLFRSPPKEPDEAVVKWPASTSLSPYRVSRDHSQISKLSPGSCSKSRRFRVISFAE